MEKMEYKCMFCKEETRSKLPMIQHILHEHQDKIMIEKQKERMVV